MNRNAIRRSSFGLLALPLFGYLVACGGRTTVKLAVEPSTALATGGKATIRVLVTNPPEHATYVWRATCGTLDPQESNQAVTEYIAPSRPCNDQVTLEVRSDGRAVSSQGIAIHVAESARKASDLQPIQDPRLLITDFSGAPGSPDVLFGAFFTPHWGSAREIVKDGGPPRGKFMQVDYDVSKSGDFSGFWLKFRLEGFRPADWPFLSLQLRGDKGRGYPLRVKVELKLSEDKWGWKTTYIDSITDEWKRYRMSLAEFDVLKDWSAADEFVLTFEHDAATAKRGTVYLDDIAFEK
jgi:hypothetical protein